ncbi:MAG TPA: dipeptide/oligopeptide/nickel ABC transporter permease/ATP-binding protein [Streptosporangiaceae bacterium]|jgi:oligopeptide/dipeptide ABC transporter ATP-binding protein
MRSRSRWLAAFRTPVGVISSILVLALIVVAIVAPSAFGHGASVDDLRQALRGPSAQHLLGTDALGRDLLDRVLVATRLSLIMAALATLIATVGGLLLGALPAVTGRRAGALIGAFINLTFAFPGLLLAMFLAIIFGLGEQGAVLAIGISGIPSIARLAQTLTASIASADYVTAARMLGVRRDKVITRHVLPNIAEPLVISVTLSLGSALLAFAALSFIGLGIQPPGYDLGELLNQGLPQISYDPAASLGPALTVVIAGAAFNLLGDAVARALGPTAVPAGRRRRSQGSAAPASPPVTSGNVLAVDDLTVAFPGPSGALTPVAGVSFALAPGEVVGIVGESGSGKSLTALGVSRLVDSPGVVSAGTLSFAGADLLTRNGPAVRALLGTSLSMVFQDPLSALNPAIKIGPQLAEVTRVHQGQPRKDALARAVDRLSAVRLPAPAKLARQYPHELSGGMRQRAVIAMGLMGAPKVIIADEPTTALDVTVQSQILDLLRTVQAQERAAILLISHDVAVVGQLCQRVLVMYAGRIVEDLPAAALAADAAHPYTRALVATVPDMTTDRDQPLATIAGRPPSPASLPPGCAFAPRCMFATEQCHTQRPALTSFGTRRRVACWHPQITEAAVPLAEGTVPG